MINQPASPGNTIKVTTANKVRLWIAGACQGIAIIVSIIIAGSFDYYPVLNTTSALGDDLGQLVIPVVFEIAAAVLAGISLWRFISPRAVPAALAPPTPAWGWTPPPSAPPQPAPGWTTGPSPDAPRDYTPGPGRPEGGRDPHND